MPLQDGNAPHQNADSYVAIRRRRRRSQPRIRKVARPHRWLRPNQRCRRHKRHEHQWEVHRARIRTVAGFHRKSSTMSMASCILMLPPPPPCRNGTSAMDMMRSVCPLHSLRRQGGPPCVMSACQRRRPLVLGRHLLGFRLAALTFFDSDDSIALVPSFSILLTISIYATIHHPLGLPCID